MGGDYEAQRKLAAREDTLGNLNGSHGHSMKALGIIIQILSEVEYSASGRLVNGPPNYQKLVMDAKAILDNVGANMKKADPTTTISPSHQDLLALPKSSPRPSSFVSSSSSITASSSAQQKRPALARSMHSNMSIRSTSVFQELTQPTRSLPLIPISPLTKLALQHSYALSQVTQKLDNAKAADQNGSNGQNNLTVLRRLIEDVRIQKTKLESVNGQIGAVADQLLVGWDADRIAKQLTIVDVQLFSKVEVPLDLITQSAAVTAAPATTNSASLGATMATMTSVRACTDFERYISHSISHLLLQSWHHGRSQRNGGAASSTVTSSPSSSHNNIGSLSNGSNNPHQGLTKEGTPNVVAHVIRIAQLLWQVYRNFNSFMAIMEALTSPEVKRMHQLWSGVSSKTKEVYKRMVTFYNNRISHNAYLDGLEEKLSAFEKGELGVVVAVPWMRYHRNEVREIINSYLTGQESVSSNGQGRGQGGIVLSAPGTRKLQAVTTTLKLCKVDSREFEEQRELLVEKYGSAKLTKTGQQEPVSIDGYKLTVTPAWDLKTLGHGDLGLHHWILSRPYLNRQQLIDESLEIEPLFHGEELPCYESADEYASDAGEVTESDDPFEHIIAPEHDLDPNPAPLSSRRANHLSSDEDDEEDDGEGDLGLFSSRSGSLRTKGKGKATTSLSWSNGSAGDADLDDEAKFNQLIEDWAAESGDEQRQSENAGNDDHDKDLNDAFQNLIKGKGKVKVKGKDNGAGQADDIRNITKDLLQNAKDLTSELHHGNGSKPEVKSEDDEASRALLNELEGLTTPGFPSTGLSRTSSRAFQRFESGADSPSLKSSPKSLASASPKPPAVISISPSSRHQQPETQLAPSQPSLPQVSQDAPIVPILAPVASKYSLEALRFQLEKMDENTTEDKVQDILSASVTPTPSNPTPLSPSSGVKTGATTADITLVVSPPPTSSKASAPSPSADPLGFLGDDSVAVSITKATSASDRPLLSSSRSMRARKARGKLHIGDSTSVTGGEGGSLFDDPSLQSSERGTGAVGSASGTPEAIKTPRKRTPVAEDPELALAKSKAQEALASFLAGNTQTTSSSSRPSLFSDEEDVVSVPPQDKDRKKSAFVSKSSVSVRSFETELPSKGMVSVPPSEWGRANEPDVSAETDKLMKEIYDSSVASAVETEGATLIAVVREQEQQIAQISETTRTTAGENTLTRTTTSVSAPITVPLSPFSSKRTMTTTTTTSRTSSESRPASAIFGATTTSITSPPLGDDQPLSSSSSTSATAATLERALSSGSDMSPPTQHEGSGVRSQRQRRRIAGGVIALPPPSKRLLSMASASKLNADYIASGGSVMDATTAMAIGATTTATAVTTTSSEMGLVQDKEVLPTSPELSATIVDTKTAMNGARNEGQEEAKKEQEESAVALALPMTMTGADLKTASVINDSSTNNDSNNNDNDNSNDSNTNPTTSATAMEETSTKSTISDSVTDTTTTLTADITAFGADDSATTTISNDFSLDLVSTSAL